jgi:hypothetical protein
LAEEGAQGEEDTRCFGSFNWKENQTAYRKPTKLLEVIRELYNIEPKQTAKAVCEQMRAMRDCDGGLLFCISKCQTALKIRSNHGSTWRQSRERIGQN